MYKKNKSRNFAKMKIYNYVFPVTYHRHKKRLQEFLELQNQKSKA